jgi:HlyD family secretion protein
VLRLHLSTLLALVFLCSCSEDEGGGIDPSLIYTIERSDLVVTVRERGEVEAARNTRISSELEGRATLIYLIPEGSVVSEGDKVAELDVSEIEERRASQAISVAKAKAILEHSRKNVEIFEKELQAAERTAETRQQIAEMRLEKFLGQRVKPTKGPDGHAGRASSGTNGEMVARLRELIEGEDSDAISDERYDRPVERVLEILDSEELLRLEMGEMANQVLQQIDEISLARVDLELAVDTLHHSRLLESKGFLTATELKRDEIAFTRQLSKKTVAWNNLELLIGYSLPESLISLQLEVENARLAVESVKASNEARRVREEADLGSIESEYALALERLENLDLQVTNGVLLATAPGLVVYGRYDWDEPVYEGMSVRERQEVIVLPDISSMMVELEIPEAQIGKLAAGQIATIVVDAFPGREFNGEVSDVSNLPDPSPRRRETKVYQADVLMLGDNTGGVLRPGMNCVVTIEVGILEGVLQVPVPALERRKNDHFVWKITPEGPVAAKVELGGNNLTHVQIVAGLVAGDRISLVRPVGAELPEEEGTAPGEDSTNREPRTTSSGNP